MTPRPFYRWKSFWLGLFVLVFLGWAWWDSYRNWTNGVVGWRGWEISHHTSYGRCLISAMASGGLRWSFEAEWERGLQLTDEELELFGMTKDDSGIPLSAVFFSTLALWSAWLFWHWKREQKKSS